MDRKKIDTKINVNELLKIAQEYAEKNENENVLYILHRAFKLEPKNPIVLAKLGMNYLIIKQPLKAIDFFNKLFELEQNLPIELCFYAQACMLWNDFATARIALEKSMKLQKTDIAQMFLRELNEIAMLRANVLKVQAEDDKKLSYYNNPDKDFENKVNEETNVDKLLKLGFEQKDHAKIVCVFERILTLEPDNISALNFYGSHLIQVGLRRTLGSLHLRRIVKLQPENPDHWANLAVGLMKSGELSCAIWAIEKAIEMNPDDENNKNLYQIIMQTKMTTDQFSKSFGF